ncbi:MAG: hypothetical protein K6F27_09700 [Ruminococcus sp.]|nr:hypothetical protein [Ruminococcus sp.]
MGNICCTMYRFKGKDVCKLYEMLEAYETPFTMEEVYKSLNIFGVLGKPASTVVNFELHEGVLAVDTDSNWIPDPEAWGVLIEEKELDVQFCFYAYEPGCEIFEVYDPYNLGDFADFEYHIEVCPEGEDQDNNVLIELGKLDTEVSAEELQSKLEELTGETDLRNAIPIASRLVKSDDTYFCIREIRRVS